MSTNIHCSFRKRRIFILPFSTLLKILKRKKNFFVIFQLTSTFTSSSKNYFLCYEFSVVSSSSYLCLLFAFIIKLKKTFYFESWFQHKQKGIFHLFLLYDEIFFFSFSIKKVENIIWNLNKDWWEFYHRKKFFVFF